MQTALGGYDLEHEVGDIIVADHVREVLGGLPDTERRPIELAYFRGHTYREVAMILGEPEGTVKSRIRSGLKRMHGSAQRLRTGSERRATVTHDEIEEMLGVYALDALRYDRAPRDRRPPRLLPPVPSGARRPPRGRGPAGQPHRSTPQPSHPKRSGTGSLPRSRTSHLSWQPAKPPRFRRSTLFIVPLGAVAAGLMLTVGLLAAKVGESRPTGQQPQASGGCHERAAESCAPDGRSSRRHPPGWRATVVVCETARATS